MFDCNLSSCVPYIVVYHSNICFLFYQTAEEWRVVFYLAAAIYLAGAVFYGLFASGERQPWAEIHSAYEPHTDEEEEE